MNKLQLSCLALSTLALAGCVDNDYDLSKDIDMTLGIGGDHLTIPPSDTDPYTMKAILDLGDDSSIKMNADGDYYVYQEGSSSDKHITIGVVKIKSTAPRHGEVTGNFQVVPSTGVPAGTKPSILIGVSGTADNWHVLTDAIENTIDVDNDGSVPESLIEVKAADVDMHFDANVTFTPRNYNGGYTINAGFTIDCGSDMTIESTVDYLNVTADGHKAVFNRDYSVAAGRGLVVPLAVSHIAVKKPWGVTADHNFSWQAQIKSTGVVTLDPNEFVIGTAPSIVVNIDTNVPAGGKVVAVDGIVNPDFDIQESDFTISGIPDFLREPGNVLDIENPLIFIAIDNSSPCTADIDLQLQSMLDGKELCTLVETVSNVKPGHNYICLSRLPYTGTETVTANVVDPKLGDLISTIPTLITYRLLDTRVKPEVLHFELGNPGYELTARNYVDFPLIFGPDLKLTSEKEDTDWDMEDMEKLNFNEVKITATVTNTIPMTFVPELVPITRDGMEVAVDVDMHDSMVAAGTPASPSVTDIEISLTGAAESLKSLEGVRYVFKGSNPEAGVQLNDAQALSLSDIRITLVGGLSYDAN